MIPAKFYRYVFAFIMSAFMAFFMSFVLTYLNLGFVDGFVKIWLIAYVKAFVVAYPVLLLVSPSVAKITQNLCKKRGKFEVWLESLATWSFILKDLVFSFDPLLEQTSL